MSSCFTRADAFAIANARAAAASTPDSAQVIRCRKTPGPIGDDADTNPLGFGIGRVADLAIFGGEPAAAFIDNARIGEGSAALCGDVESPIGDVIHDSI